MNNYFDLLPLDIHIIILSDLSSLEIESILQIIIDLIVLNKFLIDDIYNKIILYLYKDISYLFFDELKLKKWIYDEIYTARELIKNDEVLKRLTDVSLINKYKISKGMISRDSISCTNVFSLGNNHYRRCTEYVIFFSYCKNCYFRDNSIRKIEKEKEITKEIILKIRSIRLELGRDE